MIDDQKNLAETLADVLPKAAVLQQITPPTDVEGLHIVHYAIPKGHELKEVRVDLEALLPHPRRTKALANFADPASFLAYVQRHATEGSVVWCNFNPQSFALDFTAVFDEHTKADAGWRAHTAKFAPDMSTEWKAWQQHDRKFFDQVAFATFIQDHEDDITSSDGKMPTSLQMHKMATEFVMNEERVLKSSVRLQSGGVRLTYIADPDKGTTDEMELFEKFAIGIPVFHGDPSAWAITSRLKYRAKQGAVTFAYELMRADKVHKAASEELINTIRSGLASVPLLMGDCK